MSRNRCPSVSLAVVLLTAVLIAISPNAVAVKGRWVCTQHGTVWGAGGSTTVGCVRRIWVPAKRPSQPKSPGSQPAREVEPHQPTYAEKVAAIQKQNKAALVRYRQQIADLNNRYKNGQCVFKADGQTNGPDCGNVLPPTLTPIPKPGKNTKAPPPPPIPPEEAAYLAIATSLKITPSGVGIGPDPALSRWKKAVVGHSYWFWATGPSHLGPVSASAAGVRVSLDARLTSTTFSMGDGNTVTCDGPGTPYPGDQKGLYAKSPTCGYAYQTTSEHQAGGTYPVRMTTYWSVAYSTPGGSGTIPIILATERDLPVGELQTVITH